MKRGPYSMARSAVYAIDVNVGASRAERDAVIAGSDVDVSKCDSGGHTDVYTVGIGAVSGGNDLGILNGNAFAGKDRKMEVLAVDQS